MGTQRHMAVNIQRHFDVDEERAFQLARLLEDARCGDDIQDAVWPLVDHGDLPETLAQLSRVRARLDTAIEDIALAFSAIEKRKPAAAAEQGKPPPENDPETDAEMARQFGYPQRLK
jgi:hypothetical protein